MSLQTDSPSRADPPSVERKLFAVEEAFHPHLPSAATRLGYLYPKLRFTVTATGVEVSGEFEESILRHEILHAVYRERIFAETLPLRRTLIDGLLSR